jgi:hypothetical protein
MARRPRARRRERRQRGSKLLRRLGLSLVIALPLLYFAFTQVFFDPFEGSQPSFAVLVPRDVDLWARRERLDSDLVDLRPRMWDRLLATPAYKTLAATAWWQEQAWPKEFDAVLAQLSQATAGAPLDPVADLLGREVAMVGRLPAEEGGAPRLAVMLRISGKAKLAVETLDYDAGLSKAFPGATQETVQDPDVPGVSWRRLELPAEIAPGADGAWFYARRLDLLLVSRDEGLVRDVLRQVEAGEETSLGLSRLYDDDLPEPQGLAEDRLSLEFLVDVKPLLPKAPAAAGDDAHSRDALANALDKLVDVHLLGETVGRFELDDRLSLALSSDVDDAAAALPGAGLVGAPVFAARDRLRDVLGLLPADTTAALTMNVELRALLETLVASLGPDETRLLNDTIRDVARYSPTFKVDSLPGLLGYLDRTLGDEVTVALRPSDHAIESGLQPLPSLVFLFRVQDLSLWTALDDAAVRGYKALGLDPDRMKRLDEGVGERKWLGVSGLPMEEISYIVLDGETAVVGTDADFVREIVAVYTNQRSSVAGKPEVRQLVDSLGEREPANLCAWGDAEMLLRVLDPYAEYVADLDTVIDLGVLRTQKSRELLETPRYREWKEREAEMPEDVKTAFEATLDEQVKAVDDRRRQEEIPRLATAWRERRQWLKLFKQFVVAVRLGQHDASLRVQATTVLGR